MIIGRPTFFCLPGIIVIYRRVLRVKMLKFVFSGPKNEQNVGQIGVKIGYVAHNLNCHDVFFSFSPKFHIIIIFIRHSLRIHCILRLYCKNGAKIDSFSTFSRKRHLFASSKCVNKFGMVFKLRKASFSHFLTKLVPE